jgi:hypothetical protein
LVEPIEGTSPLVRARSVKAQELNCTPVAGVDDRAPDCGRRLPMAMLRALVASAAVRLVSMDQPTTRRE